MKPPRNNIFLVFTKNFILRYLCYGDLEKRKVKNYVVSVDIAKHFNILKTFPSYTVQWTPRTNYNFIHRFTEKQEDYKHQEQKND